MVLYSPRQNADLDTYRQWAYQLFMRRTIALKLKEVLLGTHSFEAMKAFYGSLLDLQVVEEGLRGCRFK